MLEALPPYTHSNDIVTHFCTCGTLGPHRSCGNGESSHKPHNLNRGRILFDFEKLIITDNSNSHEKIPAPDTIEYHPPSSLRAREEEIVRELVCRQKMLPRRVILRDYNYLRPDLELCGEADVDPQGRGDVYLYGEHFKTPEEGNELAKIRAQEILCRERIFTGGSTVPTFCPGYLFQLTGHYRQDMDNQRLLLTEVEHQGDQSLALLGAGHGETAEAIGLNYSNRFTCIPFDVPYRPPRITPKPVIDSAQTAIVVGPSGEEIYTDKHGRGKGQFPWDREGKKNENSSCWIRVAHNVAGKKWGFMTIPRIGQEVVVEFLEGDPDRPLVTGVVYNAEQMPHYTLPDEKTKSYVKTNSSMGGDGHNEVRFEDKAGEEQFYMHAQKNMDVSAYIYPVLFRENGVYLIMMTKRDKEYKNDTLFVKKIALKHGRLCYSKKRVLLSLQKGLQFKWH